MTMINQGQANKVYSAQTNQKPPTSFIGSVFSILGTIAAVAGLGGAFLFNFGLVGVQGAIAGFCFLAVGEIVKHLSALRFYAHASLSELQQVNARLAIKASSDSNVPTGGLPL